MNVFRYLHVYLCFSMV